MALPVAEILRDQEHDPKADMPEFPERREAWRL